MTACVTLGHQTSPRTRNILKRIEIQRQLVSFALIAPGTVLALGFQINGLSLMLIYPLLGMFLSAVWLSKRHGFSTEK